MKKLSIFMLSLIALLCLLPFIGECQEFDSKSWSDYTSSKPERPEWLIDTDSIPLDDTIRTCSWYHTPKEISILKEGWKVVIDTCLTSTGFTINPKGIGSTRLIARSELQAPKLLKIIAGESSIEFSLDKGLMTAKLVGSEDSVAQSFINNVLTQYNSELSLLRNKVDSLSSIIDKLKKQDAIPVLIKQTGTGTGYWQVDVLAQENGHGLANIESIFPGDYIKFEDKGVEYKLRVSLVYECYQNYARVRLVNDGVMGIASVPTTMATLMRH